MSSNQYEMPSGGMPPRVGMSTPVKVLIILCVVFGGLAVVCCGGMAILGPMFASKMKESVSDNPQQIAAKTAEMAQIDVPAVLAPKASFDMKIPFTDQRMMLWVVYADQNSDSMLMLFAMGDMLAKQNQDQMRQSIDQSLQQQNMRQEQITIERTSTKERQINGQPATFTIQHGKGKDSQTERIQVSGVFQGKTGPVMLMMNVDAQKIGEEEIVKMLDSIE